MKLIGLTLTAPYLELDPIFYHKVDPAPLKNPRMVSLNPDAARLLGLNSEQIYSEEIELLLNGKLKLQHYRFFSQ